MDQGHMPEQQRQAALALEHRQGRAETLERAATAAAAHAFTLELTVPKAMAAVVAALDIAADRAAMSVVLAACPVIIFQEILTSHGSPPAPGLGDRHDIR